MKPAGRANPRHSRAPRQSVAGPVNPFLRNATLPNLSAFRQTQHRSHLRSPGSRHREYRRDRYSCTNSRERPRTRIPLKSGGWTDLLSVAIVAIRRNPGPAPIRFTPWFTPQGAQRTASARRTPDAGSGIPLRHDHHGRCQPELLVSVSSQFDVLMITLVDGRLAAPCTPWGLAPNPTLAGRRLGHGAMPLS